MSSLYEPFLAMLPPAAEILDAGCGSGRDAKAFLERGYAVTAFDGSERMAAESARITGIPVTVQRFQDLDYRDDFDGIWACASLLHVPHAELPEAMRRIERTLRTGGVLYASFKLGEGERVDGERFFVDFTEEDLRRFIGIHCSLNIERLWRTMDIRAEARGQWINAILRKPTGAV